MLIQDENGTNLNIGTGWTLLATQCYLKKKCKKCLYNIYCQKLFKPILKKVVIQLLSRFGKPSEALIEEAKDLNIRNDKMLLFEDSVEF